jgi:hypothetical protein
MKFNFFLRSFARTPRSCLLCFACACSQFIFASSALSFYIHISCVYAEYHRQRGCSIHCNRCRALIPRLLPSFSLLSPHLRRRPPAATFRFRIPTPYLYSLLRVPSGAQSLPCAPRAARLNLAPFVALHHVPTSASFSTSVAV